MTRRFRAPAGNGEVLADPPFSEIPRLVEENRRRLDRTDVRIGGVPLRELRALARREALDLAEEPGNNPGDKPLILAGHQPELSHPGVWVKHFALNGIARRVGGVPLNLIVDNDTLKSAALHIPNLPGRGPKVFREAVAFDRFDSETPYEDRRVLDPNCFRTFPHRVAEVAKDWSFRPLLPDVWRPDATHVGNAFTAIRLDREQAWGCRNHELSVSRLSRTEAFRRFAAHIVHDPIRFAEVYNAAILEYRRRNGVRSANHPAPELAHLTDGLSQGGGYETPFWEVARRAPRRSRLFTDIRMNRFWYWADDYETGPDWTDVAQHLRPRALTLTLFARVCLGDFFVHGIGGGKYDEVTDAIIRDYFGVEAPAYQVLSATLHLPLPAQPATDDDVKRRERLVRDLHWNPQRHLTPENASRPEVRALMAELTVLIAGEPAHGKRAERRAWFRALQSVHERLRPFVWKQVAPAEARLKRARVEAAANAVLRRRDYSWVLYPEEALRPFLQRFLDV